MACSPHETYPIANLPRALSRMDGNRQLLAGMVRIYLEDIPTLRNDLQQFLQVADHNQARRIAHNIKGLAATFDSFPVTEVAAEIESLTGLGRSDQAIILLPKLSSEMTRLEQALRDYIV